MSSLRWTLVALGLIPLEISAQIPPDGRPSLDGQIVNQRPEFLVRAWVDRKDAVYTEGDALTITVRCEQDAYLYILYQQADGKVFQIFPNSGQPENRIKARQDVQVPSADDGFRWVVGAPFGPEIIKVIASKQPIDALSIPGLKRDRFNPVSQGQLDGASRQVAQGPANVWSEDDLKITTVGRGQPISSVATPRRVGVFFGVSEYQFDELQKQLQRDEMKATAGKVDESAVRSINLGAPRTNAEDMARVLTGSGQLAEAKVFVNRDATRAKIKEMITEWLPSVSKPGDTVFIYYSGHGSQIPDDDGDEKDGLDETLEPYDSFGLDEFPLMLRQAEAGQLDPEMLAKVQRWYQEYAQVRQRALSRLGGPTVAEAVKQANFEANLFLLHLSRITDDEMGHWVQKLDGRRVVVILDSCHSGGMNKTDGSTVKDLEGGRTLKGSFDFLSGEFARLKDLDQPSLTVIAAASEQESSAEWVGARNSIFTGFLLKLLSLGDPVDARSAVELTRSAIVENFKRVNAKLDEIQRENPSAKVKRFEPFTPTLFSTDPQPVFLRPAAGSSETKPGANQE